MRINEIIESADKHITFCFGRMNPPTIGHKHLLDTMANVGGEYKIFVSRTNDTTRNPLTYQQKVSFLKEMFPEHAPHIVVNESLNTLHKVAVALYDAGYTQVTFVGGSDRVDDMVNALHQYNGVDNSVHGYYYFTDIKGKLSGEREDGAAGISGISATGARDAARHGNLEAFKKTTGTDGDLATRLFTAVRHGLGVTEEAAGVGIITKQNTTKDVNKGTINKNLRKFKL